jgi:hypothetical protein
MTSRQYIFFIPFILLSFLSVSQIDKKKWKTANDYFEIEDYFNALKIYKEIYPKDSLNGELNYKIGSCLYYMKWGKAEAYEYFRKAENANYYEAYYYLGMLEHERRNLETACKYYDKYKDWKTTDKKVSDERIAKLLEKSNTAIIKMASPEIIRLENLGDNINTAYPEYVPLLSADENTLIFTSRRPGSSNDLKDPYGNYFEDIYIAHKQENGEWSTPKSISKNINGNSHDACVALAPNGERLIVYKAHPTLRAGSLYESYFDGSDWTVPVKIRGDINSEEYLESSATISADEQIIYFSSNRPGGYGGLDLYRIVKLPNGEWSKAQNLGPKINTSDNEDSPFIHADGKTLYFSSTGHTGMGGYDIFKSTIDEEGNWTEPINLGYPLNTVFDDIFFTMNIEGNAGYVSTERNDSRGGTDIYKALFPKDNIELFLFSGKIYQPNSNSITASVKVYNKETNSLVGEYQPNRNTGKFVAILPEKEWCYIEIEAEGYEKYKFEFLKTSAANITFELKPKKD